MMTILSTNWSPVQSNIFDVCVCVCVCCFILSYFLTFAGKQKGQNNLVPWPPPQWAVQQRTETIGCKVERWALNAEGNGFCWHKKEHSDLGKAGVPSPDKWQHLDLGCRCTAKNGTTSKQETEMNYLLLLLYCYYSFILALPTNRRESKPTQRIGITKKKKNWEPPPPNILFLLFFLSRWCHVGVVVVLVGGGVAVVLLSLSLSLHNNSTNNWKTYSRDLSPYLVCGHSFDLRSCQGAAPDINLKALKWDWMRAGAWRARKWAKPLACSLPSCSQSST